MQLYVYPANIIYTKCPKGWKMATSEVESEANRKPLLNNGSFAYMLGKYGFEFDKVYGPNGTYYHDTTANAAPDLAKVPFYYVASGNIYPGFVALSSTGESASYRGSYAYNTSNAYILSFNNRIHLYPAVWVNRYGTYSLRCLAHLIFLTTYTIRFLQTGLWATYLLLLSTATSPFYFSRGGYIHLGDGSQRAVGFNGDYWSSSVATSQPHAYVLHFNSAVTYPSLSYSRWFGFSVR